MRQQEKKCMCVYVGGCYSMKEGFPHRTIPLESQQVCVCVQIVGWNYEPGTKWHWRVGGLMKGPLCPTCSLSAVVSLLKRQLFLRRSVCLCVFVNVSELE